VSTLGDCLSNPTQQELMPLLHSSRIIARALKNIGIMFFGLGASDNPRSVMYRNILGVDDLDRMTEFVLPR